MAWLTLLLAVLLQAGAPASPTSSSPRQSAAAPVRPRLCRETGLSSASAAPAVALLISADHHRPKVANRRFSERRIRPVADALVGSDIPAALIVERTAGGSGTRLVTPDGVPDPLLVYARIIFPVPPPLG